MENKEIFIENINDLIEKKDFKTVAEILIELQPVDIAEAFEELSVRERAMVYRLLPKNMAAEVFVELQSDMQEELILSFTDNELNSTLKELFIDDTVDIIEEMPANVVRRILKTCPPTLRNEINSLLAFSDNTAGSIMTTEYVALKPEMTVTEAFKHIRKAGLDSETVYTLYVKDEKRTLLGVVTIKDLLLNDENEKIKNIMNENVIYVETLSDREEAAKLLDKYDFLALPVTDKEKRLVGIITVDDAIDVIFEEVEEDFSKMAAVMPIEDPYFKTSVFKHSLSRILWLIVLMVSATVTGFIITNYEEAFKAVPLLIACLPMLMGTGGNCGSQASIMVIRALATDEINLKDILKVWWKEIRISLVVGVVLALVNTLRVFLLYGFTHEILLLAITNALALLFTVALAQSLGCLLPMGAKAIKLDPAIMAAPLITTIVDALSVMVFFLVAVNVFAL